MNSDKNIFVKYALENVEEINSCEFKPLSWYREILLSKDELPDYYRQKREYNYNNNLSLKGMELRAKFHPILLELISLNRQFIDKQDFTFINEESLERNKAINDDKEEKPVIFAITHIGKFDYQIVSEAIRKHQIPFAGDPETMYRTLDGFFMNLNGVVYCDTESRTDRKIAKDTAMDVVNHDMNLAIYPEGVWNMSPNLLMLPLYPGVIEMAQRTGCDIMPIAIEQYDSNFYINIGKPFKVDSRRQVNRFFRSKIGYQKTKSLNSKELNKLYIDQKRHELRDEMARLKWEILEKKPIVERSSLGPFKEEYKRFVDTRLNEWVDPKTKIPFYNMDLIKHRTFKEKGVDAPEDVFSYFKKLDINKNNAFLFRNNDFLPNDIQEYLEEYLCLHNEEDSDKTKTR